jgi:hypothetical protein
MIGKKLLKHALRGIVYFQDGTILHIREFVDVELSIDRGKYSYQYMDQDDRLIFRYENLRKRWLGQSSNGYITIRNHLDNIFYLLS